MFLLITPVLSIAGAQNCVYVYVYFCNIGVQVFKIGASVVILPTISLFCNIGGQVFKTEGSVAVLSTISAGANSSGIGWFRPCAKGDRLRIARHTLL